MPRGIETPMEVCELVVKLKEYFDENQWANTKKSSSFQTADALKIGIATVKRILSRYNKAGTVIPKQRRKSGRHVKDECERLQIVIRDYVRSQNLHGKKISVEKIRSHLLNSLGVEIDKSTLWRALKRWGFTFGIGRRRDSLREQDYVIHARREYLRAIRANRRPDGSCVRPEVYLDETYINKNHSQDRTWYADEDGPWVNKPSGVGPRLIIVDAISQTGWIDGARLVFEAKKKSGDYHGQMNWQNFSTWFKSRLLPNIPEESIIVMDNAPYHNTLVEKRFPLKSSTVSEMRDWLTHNGHAWRDDMLKSELYDLCVKHAPKPEFKLDCVASAYGHRILRTPQYHFDLQPIEKCWAIVKNHMASGCDFTMKGMRSNLNSAFSKVTKKSCEKIIKAVRDKENQYWIEDAILDSEYSMDSDLEDFSERKI